MKHSIKTVFLMCLLIFSQANAQEINITSFHDERPFNWKIDETMTNLVLKLQATEDNDYVYSRIVRGKDDNKLFIAKVQKSNGKTIWEKETPFVLYDSKIASRYCHLEKTEDGFCIFFYKYVNKKVCLTAQKLTENFKPNGEEIILTQQDGPFGSFRNFLVSRNAGLLLFYEYNYNIRVTRSDGSVISTVVGDDKNIVFSTVLIDTKLNILWKKDVSGPKDKFAELECAYVTKDKNVGLLFKYTTTNNQFGANDVDYGYSLSHYNYEKSEFTSQLVDFENKFKHTFDSRVSFDASQNTLSITSGYHRTKRAVRGSFYKCEGIFNIEYDLNTAQRVKYQFVPFTDEFKGSILGAKKAAKGQLEYPTLVSKMTQSDGNTTFVFKAVLYIAILNITPSGEIKWFKTFTDKGYHMPDILSFDYSDITYFLFTAFENVALAPEKSGYFSFGKGDRAIVVLAYDSKGTMVNTKIFKAGYGKFFYCDAEKSVMLDNNKFQLELGDSKTEQTFSGFLEVK